MPHLAPPLRTIKKTKDMSKTVVAIIYGNPVNAPQVTAAPDMPAAEDPDEIETDSDDDSDSTYENTTPLFLRE